jgi:hypothetical protein
MRKFLKSGRLAALAGALALVTAPCIASTFLDVDIPTLRTMSSSVVVARVQEVESSWNEDGTMIFTQVTVAVQRTLVGTHQASLTLRVPGGSVAGFSLRMAGAPEFRVGERALIFVAAWDDGAPMVSGYAQGVSRIARDQAGNEMLRGGIANGMALAQLVRELRGAGR